MNKTITLDDALKNRPITNAEIAAWEDSNEISVTTDASGAKIIDEDVLDKLIVKRETEREHVIAESTRAELLQSFKAVETWKANIVPTVMSALTALA
ncbi:MAG: hypothetical protein ACE5FS_05860, partial [Paracoccaceae bacterium]